MERLEGFGVLHKRLPDPRPHVLFGILAAVAMLLVIIAAQELRRYRSTVVGVPAPIDILDSARDESRNSSRARVDFSLRHAPEIGQ